MASQGSRLTLTSLKDVEIATHSEFGTEYRLHSFSYLGPDDEAWYGEISKRGPSDNPTLAEVNQLIRPVEEALIYPEKPLSFRVAPTLQNVHIKRPGFKSHNENVPHFHSKTLLHEASIMEQIPAHPNIVTYYGCRVRRGRITGIVLERLPKTLMESPRDISNIPAFLAELQSAVDHLHSLGLAHNDITPYNIMIKDDGRPVLIDFGACGPPGYLVDFLGTPGWRESHFWHSKMDHDIYAMRKLRTWLENGGKHEDE